MMLGRNMIVAAVLVFAGVCAAADDKPAMTLTGYYADKPVKLLPEVQATAEPPLVKLLAACYFSARRAETIDDKAWKELLKDLEKEPHFHITFAKPRAIKADVDGKPSEVGIDEVVLIRPKENGPSSIWVRSGNKYMMADKYEGVAADDLYAWMKAARVVP